MNSGNAGFEHRARSAMRRITGGNTFEVGVLSFAVLCLVLTVAATIRVSRTDSTADLSFDGMLQETSALIRNRGSEGIASYRTTSLSHGSVRVSLDSLAMSGDSILFPSLAKGGFLRDQIDRFNDHASRIAYRNLYRSSHVPPLEVGTPSVFRLMRTDSGYQVLSSDLNEYSLAVPSPRRDRRWITVRTADGRNGPSLVGMFSTIDLTQRDSSLSSPQPLSGTDCRVQRRGVARLL